MWEDRQEEMATRSTLVQSHDGEFASDAQRLDLQGQ